MIFIWASISIKELNIDMLMKILESYLRVREMKLILIFPIVVLFLYLAIIVLDNSPFLVGSISVSKNMQLTPNLRIKSLIQINIIKM